MQMTKTCRLCAYTVQLCSHISAQIYEITNAINQGSRIDIGPLIIWYWATKNTYICIY